jgi:hypothetical protein
MRPRRSHRLRRDSMSSVTRFVLPDRYCGLTWTMTKWKNVSAENVTFKLVKPLVTCPATLAPPIGMKIGIRHVGEDSWRNGDVVLTHTHSCNRDSLRLELNRSIRVDNRGDAGAGARCPGGARWSRRSDCTSRAGRPGRTCGTDRAGRAGRSDGPSRPCRSGRLRYTAHTSDVPLHHGPRYHERADTIQGQRRDRASGTPETAANIRPFAMVTTFPSSR